MIPPFSFKPSGGMFLRPVMKLRIFGRDTFEDDVSLPADNSDCHDMHA